MPSKATGRKVTDAHEAKQLLAEWSSSGLPMAAWCKRRGINWCSLAAFKGWPKRNEQAFIELDAAVPLQNNRTDTVYRICVGPYTVETGASFDDDTLRRLLVLVASC